MRFLLNVVYLIALVAISPWLLWQAITKDKYREGWGAKLWGVVPRRSGQGQCIWLHAVSVGEVSLLAPLVDELQGRCSAVELVISTTTKTGYDLARQKYPNLTVFYCPLDFSWAVRRAVRRIRPTCLVLVELEIWPNLIDAVSRFGAQTAVVNGRLSRQSFRGYRRIRAVMRRVLAKLAWIAVQNEEYAERFRSLGASAEQLVITGSLKYDGAETSRTNALTMRLATLAGIGVDDVVLLAGSTQPPEEQLALETFRILKDEFPRLRLMLVPRHPHRFDSVAELLDRSGLCWQRRSRLETGGASPDARILLVDSVGELHGWWGTASIAFVGGSLGQRGGQNMIEPAAYGAAVCFGPNTRNFRDVVEALLACDGALVVDSGAALTAFVRKCLVDPAYTEALGGRAARLVGQGLGATTRTADQLVARLGIETAKTNRRSAAA